MNTQGQMLATASLPYPIKPYEIQLKDHILGKAVGLTEWISNELHRLRQNQVPRHCESYETLFEVIDDPTRFQISMFTLNKGHSYCSNNDEERRYDHNDTEIDSGRIAYNTNPSSASRKAFGSQKSDKNIGSKVHIQYQSISPPPTWLCKVFVELIRYCSRGSTTIHAAAAPKLLLYEFEKIRRDKKNGKPVDIPLFKERLLAILFGKIQLTQYLVKSWKSMCEWVSNSQIDDTKWLELSQNAYFIAIRLWAYETQHRLQQQYRQKKKKMHAPPASLDTSNTL